MADQPMDTETPEPGHDDAPETDTPASASTVPVPTAGRASGDASVDAPSAAEPELATEAQPSAVTAPVSAIAPPDKASKRYSPRPLITRRKLLVAGGGLLVVGGTGLAVAEMKYGKQIKKLVTGKLSPTPVPILTPHPQKLPDGPASTPNDLVIFDGALASGWQDRSWGGHTVGDSSVTYHGKPVISMDVNNWSGISLHTDPFDTSGFAYLQCYASAESKGNQLITTWMDAGASIWLGGSLLGDYTQGGAIVPGTWNLVRVPLDRLKATSVDSEGVILQAYGAGRQGTIYLADVRLVYYPDMNAPKVGKLWAYDLGTITLAFQYPMDPNAAANEGNYQIAAASGTDDAHYPAGHPVTPLRARYHTDPHTVSLTVPAALKSGGAYTVTLAPIADKFGVKSVKGLQGQVTITSNPLTAACDVSGERHPISPEIYGISNVNDHDLARDLGVTLARWGGTPQSRYNWKLGNAFNSGSDYYFQNGNYGHNSPADSQPSGVADQQVATDRAYNMTTMLQVPTVGWVANGTAPARSVGVPGLGGAPISPGSDAIYGYDPTYNRSRMCWPSRARKGSAFQDPPNLNDQTVAQDEWVHHLVNKFGPASSGGVKYYAMDNEPEIWIVEEQDVRPAELSYEQMRDMHLDYATAIKDVDPSALITGPVTWHWLTLQYSPLDRGNDNYKTHADFNAHNKVPFMEWWLAQIKAHDDKAGRRSLDVLDIHLYPQGNVYSDDASPEMAALRLRSTRELWDPTYTEESWIKQKMQAIRRLKAMIAKNYPGTKLGLSEWSWGAEGSVNGGVALAEVLGIFTREGLDLAAYWGALSYNTPAHFAFKMFGNYDSKGASFIGSSYTAVSTNNNLLSCYGAQPNGKTLLLMLINKSPDSDLTPTIQLKHVGANFGGATPKVAHVWRYWPSDAAGIMQGSDIDLSGQDPSNVTLTYTLPAYSLTLLRVEA